MPYTPHRPNTPPPSEELRARIPGWGVDLDPADRPSVPRFQPHPGIDEPPTWEFPERQPEDTPRERSIEHAMLTPVFGTSVPTKGLSGVVRRYSYRRFSEGRAAHWLLLLGADRVDVMESRVTGLLRGKPDNPITETGILSERKARGLSSRLGSNHTDIRHQALDPVIAIGPSAAVAVAAYAGVRKVLGRRS